MRILDYSIWWASIALELLLLARAFSTKLRFRYPVFYIYILFVLSQSFLRIAVYHYNSDLYSYIYWITEFVGVAIGCGVVFEIYRVSLESYPGTARMARRLLALVFVLALAKALADASDDPRWWAEATTIDVERAVRTVQALAIAALVGLFLIYAIPFGRNLKGILLGYSLFIGASVMWFTFAKSGGTQFRDLWAYLNPGSYDLALSLWVVYLWSPQFQSDLAPHNVQLENDYQRVAARTRRRLQDARGYLGKAIDQ
jgi:hypothetical protein